MNEIDFETLITELRRDEGVRYIRYLDTVGKWTIGVGHNIDADPKYPFTKQQEPLNDNQVNQLLANDIDNALNDLNRNAPWWTELSGTRQRVLANMCFNMGWPTLAGFTNTLKCIQTGDYNQAAVNMLASKWAKQVGARANRLATMMRVG